MHPVVPQVTVHVVIEVSVGSRVYFWIHFSKEKALIEFDGFHCAQKENTFFECLNALLET